MSLPLRHPGRALYILSDSSDPFRRCLLAQESLPAHAIACTTGDAGAPPPPVIQVTSISADAFSGTQRVGIEWDPPPSLQPIDQYILSFQGAATDFPILNVGQRRRVATFQGLLGQTVWIRVRAHTIFGWGPDGEVRVLLLQAPSAPPSSVSVLNPPVLAEQSLLVAWSLVPYADRYYLRVFSNAAAGGGISGVFAPDRESGPYSGNETVLGNLLADVVYRVQVAAGNADGNSSWSVYAAGKTAVAAQPTGPVLGLAVAFVTETSVGLKWLPPAGAANDSPITFYQVSVALSSSGGAAIVNRVEVPGEQSPDATIAGLVTGVAYVFAVVPRSANAGGYSGVPSVNVSATPVAPPDSVPSDFRVSAIVDRNVSLAWTVNISNLPGAATAYLVIAQESGRPVFEREVQIAVGSLGNMLTCIVPFLTPGLSYSFHLTPRNLNIAGYEKSPSAVIDNVFVIGLPMPVYDLRVTSLNDYSVSLQWQPSLVLPAATKFRIFWRVGRTIFSDASMMETSVPKASISGLSRGILYEFRVYAGNLAGFETTGSNSVPARPMPIPLPLNTVRVIGITETSISLSWEPSKLTFANSYLILFGDNHSVETQDIFYTISGLVPGVPVRFTVFARSFNSLGYEEPGISLTVTPVGPPGLVSTLTVVNVTASSVDLAFDPLQLVNATAFLVQYKRDSDRDFTNFSEYVCRADEQFLQSTPTCLTRVSVTGLVPIVKYDFKVLLRNSNLAGYRDGGNVTTAVPVFKPTLPASNLQVIAVTDTTVSLQFTFPEGVDSPTRYRIVYSDILSSPGAVESETADFFSQSIIVTGLVLGNTYKFQVIGRNLNKEGYSGAVRSAPLIAGPYLKPSRVRQIAVINVSGSSPIQSSISIRWIPPLSGIVTLFKIEIANASVFDGGSWIPLAKIGLAPQFQLAGFTVNTEFIASSSPQLPFYFNVPLIIRVSARNLNSDGYGNASNTLAIPILPPAFAPQGIFASNVTLSSIFLNWTPSQACLSGNETVTKYLIEGCAINCGSSGTFPARPVLGQKFYAAGGCAFFFSFV